MKKFFLAAAALAVSALCAEDVRQFHELGPFDVSVALDAGVGCNALEVVGDEGLYDAFLEHGCAVVGMISYAQDLAGTACVVNLTAAAVVAFEGAESDANDLVSLFF